MRPELTLHGNNDATARVNVRFNHGPNTIDVGVTDRCVRNGGVSPDGLFIALRNGQGLDFEYGACRGPCTAAAGNPPPVSPRSTNPSCRPIADFGRRSPTIRMKSSICVADRLVLVKYSHAMSTNGGQAWGPGLGVEAWGPGLGTGRARRTSRAVVPAQSGARPMAPHPPTSECSCSPAAGAPAGCQQHRQAGLQHRGLHRVRGVDFVCSWRAVALHMHGWMRGCCRGSDFTFEIDMGLGVGLCLGRRAGECFRRGLDLGFGVLEQAAQSRERTAGQHCGAHDRNSLHPKQAEPPQCDGQAEPPPGRFHPGAGIQLCAFLLVLGQQ